MSIGLTEKSGGKKINLKNAAGAASGQMLPLGFPCSSRQANKTGLTAGIRLVKLAP